MPMEFIAVFLVCLLVLAILVVGLAFGRTPAYRPQWQYVLQLLRGVADRTTNEQAWALFVNTPITHDADLEAFRWRCYQFDEGAISDCPRRPGINGYLYDRAGREYIAALAEELEKVIRERPVTRDF